jgi:hypothetical protein
MSVRLLRLVSLVAAMAVGAPMASVLAGSGASGPLITAPENAVPGERITVRVSGFDTEVVTVSLCGNEARRGSADCNLPGSKAIGTAGNAAPVESDFIVVVPPTTCPCVLRATSRDGTQVAVTPIGILGHPLGPLQGQPPVSDVVDLDIAAEPVDGTTLDRLRRALGGPATYELTVEVTNTSGVTLRNLVLSAAVSTDGEEPATIVVPKPEAIGPGDTYEMVVEHSLAALDVGTTVWTAEVSGAGDSVSVSTTTSYDPTLLIVAILLIVFLLLLIPLRHIVARHRERQPEMEGDEQPVDDRELESV